MPSVSFWSQDNDYSGAYKTTIYHTQYNTLSLINWQFFGDISKFEFRVAKQFDRGLLPYTLGTRCRRTSAAALETPLVAGDAAGSDRGARSSRTSRSAATPYVRLRRRRRSASHRQPPSSYDAIAEAGHLPAARRAGRQRPAHAASRSSPTRASRRSTGSTARRTRSTRSRATSTACRRPYDALDQTVPDYDTAAAAVGGTGLMWYGTNFSRAGVQEGAAAAPAVLLPRLPGAGRGIMASATRT